MKKNIILDSFDKTKPKKDSPIFVILIILIIALIGAILKVGFFLYQLKDITEL